MSDDLETVLKPIKLSEVPEDLAVAYAAANPDVAVTIAGLYPERAASIASLAVSPAMAVEIAKAVPEKKVEIVMALSNDLETVFAIASGCTHSSQLIEIAQAVPAISHRLARKWIAFQGKIGTAVPEAFKILLADTDES